MERSLKPWREVAVPHEDVLRGTFQQAEFAADLSRVHDGTASPDYQDPQRFYQRTFITEGMRLLLDSVIRRLNGTGGEPVIQLQTAFGGGKTHTLLAVYHLAKGLTPTESLQGVEPILSTAGISKVASARLAVLDGNRQAPNISRRYDGLSVNTLWGELAWQLGGQDAYALVREADESGTSPGKEVLAQLLSSHAPCLVLVDELVAYIRQFEEGKALAGGTFDSNISFVQALTEAMKAVPTAMLLASLPESEKEAGSRHGQKALKVLEHYVGRVQALWKPVASEEAFEIVRRRLFRNIDQTSARATCRAFADLYLEFPDDLPRETQEARYYERLTQAYPIHPELFDRLYQDWSSLESFQRTRGVLKLMAKVIHRLWKDNNSDAMILPGSLPLYDPDSRNELLYYLPSGWDPVVEGDIDGERANSASIENSDPRLGAVQACRRVARTIFLGSAPTPGQVARGLELSKVVLGTVQPGTQPSIFKDAMRRLQERLHHLNSANERHWFDTRPNLRREMEERKRRFDERDDLFPELRSRLGKQLRCDLFEAIHLFTADKDISDDNQLRLVLLPPDVAYAKALPKQTQEAANRILTRRGEQPRSKQNRILFLAADFDATGRLREQIRTVLAWDSIVKDAKDERILLDQSQIRQAAKSLQDAEDALKRMLPEAYRWVLSPVQQEDPKKGLTAVEWEAFALNSGAQNMGLELTRVLKEHELVIDEWSPRHLTPLLQRWFWKDQPHVSALDVWQKTCQYLYLPRLAREATYRKTVEAGAISRDFFGLAFGHEDGRYTGFRWGHSAPITFDQTLLLIHPDTAQAWEEQTRQEQAESVSNTAAADGNGAAATITGASVAREKVERPEPAIRATIASAPPKYFYGSLDVDPIKAKMQLVELVDEVVNLFTSKPGVDVKIKVEIQADGPAGFDENLQRAIRMNCAHLSFRTVEFEAEG